MLLTKNIIKFNKLLVKIPKQTKRVWDLAENRWGYKFLSKKKNIFLNGERNLTIFLFTFNYLKKN